MRGRFTFWGALFALLAIPSFAVVGCQSFFGSGYQMTQLGFRAEIGGVRYDTAENAWLGSNSDYLLSFWDGSSTWAGTDAVVDASIALYPEKAPVFAVPLAVTASSLAATAAGAGDAAFTHMANAVLTAYPDATEIVFRLGWEMNIPGSYPWYATGVETDFIAAWQRAVGIIRAIDPRIKFSFNPNVARDAFTAMYPGDSYVDYIGMDVYYRPSGNADPWAQWNSFYSTGTAPTISDIAAFAVTHSKPLTIEEWGVCKGDNLEYYVAAMANFIRTTPVVHHGYWDKNNPSDSASQCRMSDNQYPQTAAFFKTEFGPPAITNPSSAYASTTATTYIPLTASKGSGGRYPTGAWSIIGVAPTGFSISGRTLVVSTSAAVGVTSVRVLYTDENSQTADMTIKVTVRSTALPSWSMTNLGANLVAWWDISNASSVTSSGGFASAVTDLTGNGHDLTQSTGANQPAYSATGRNSLPALTCDGSNDFMVIGAPTTLPAIGQSFTMGGELWGDAALGSFKYILGLGTDTANLTGGIGADSSGYIRPQLTETVVTPNGDNTTSLIKGADGVVIWRLGAANANSRQLSRVSLDGSSTLHKSLGQALATTNQARLCGYPSSSTAATSNWKGGLQEGFIAMPDVTDEQKLIIDGYLAWKWGRQSSLPSDHPFKNAAPLAIH